MSNLIEKNLFVLMRANQPPKPMGVAELFTLMKGMEPAERGALDLFRIINKGPYTGRGRREGSPGSYRYYYDDAKPSGGAAVEEKALEAVNGEDLWNELIGMGFVAKLDHLPDQTSKANKDVNGNYTEERSKLHNKIAAEFLGNAETVPDNMKPVAVIMMGGPGSGKSSTTQGMSFDNFVAVDPDAVKKQIPEYNEGVQGKALNAAFMAHNESSDVAGIIRETAISQRKNVLLDGTGKNGDKMEKQVKKLAEEGYHIKLIMPHITVDEGKQRAAARAKTSGRWVPMEVLDEAYGAIPTNFDRISSMPEVAEANLYDNMGTPEEGARLMFSKKDGQTQIHNDDMYQSFQGFVSR